MKAKGVLYLIPNSLGGNYADFGTAEIRACIPEIAHFVVEELRSARRLLRALGDERDFATVAFSLLNEHTPESGLPELMQPLLDGYSIGLISEAGCPCIADPGSHLVRLAHQHHIRVRPMGMPSSILATLMASGLNGQQFTFHGYLPRDRQQRTRLIRSLDDQAHRTGYTQLFMDAPYRNDQVMEDILATCRGETLLCIGSEISMASERITLLPVSEWKRRVPSLHKKPVMFALGN